MNAAVSLTIVGLVLAGAIGLGVWGVRRVQMDPHQLIVGGRSFGTLFLWVLLAGEIYSSFTFLGAAGWAYGKGAPAYYILCYGTLAYVLSYYLGPLIWRVSQAHGLLTGPDFFVAQYGSRALGGWVSLVSVVFIVPYMTLQLSGIQTLLRIAGYDAFNSTVAVGAAFVLIIGFVFACGLRGVAWASLVKDALVLGGVVFAGVWLPIHFFGSPAAVIDHVVADHPGWLTLSSDLSTRGTTWFVSTVVLTALGFYMWPQTMAALYSAHDEEPIRRNAIYLPLYQLMLLLVYFAGWTALLVVPGLQGAKADESFMLIVQRY
ncbi:MAG: sodium:solute symporter family protein, partial [Rhodospirillales bacterium]|nr:sodium:solute symporter family protein [Acetobacter sp.]